MKLLRQQIEERWDGSLLVGLDVWREAGLPFKQPSKGVNIVFVRLGGKK